MMGTKAARGSRLPEQALPPVQCEFLKDTEAAAVLGISVATLRRWRLLGKGPRAIKLGSSVRYRRADLEEWISTQPACGGVAEVDR
jgi:excisionase family DNA binding protein